MDGMQARLCTQAYGINIRKRKVTTDSSQWGGEGTQPSECHERLYFNCIKIRSNFHPQLWITSNLQIYLTSA